MKCLEECTAEQVKEMSLEELKVLWAKIQEETAEKMVREKIIEMIQSDTDAKGNLIEN